MAVVSARLHRVVAPVRPPSNSFTLCSSPWWGLARQSGPFGIDDPVGRCWLVVGGGLGDICLISLTGQTHLGAEEILQNCVDNAAGDRATKLAPSNRDFLESYVESKAPLAGGSTYLQTRNPRGGDLRTALRVQSPT